jgi:hypothetical protein
MEKEGGLEKNKFYEGRNQLLLLREKPWIS